MSIAVILNIVKWVIYLFCITAGAYIAYVILTNEQERKQHRSQLVQETKERKKMFENRHKDSELQKIFDNAGLSFIKPLPFLFFRVGLIITVSGYYIINSALDGFQLTSLLVIPVMIIVTEPFVITEWFILFMPTAMFLRMLTKARRRKKHKELFNLFDLLKAEIRTMKTEEQVNTYYIIKQLTPMFESIQGNVSRFLALWRSSPDKASKVFSEEIGGDTSAILGELLRKIDRTDPHTAIHIIETESSVFTTSFMESEMQEGTKKNNVRFGIGMGSSVLTFVWLIMFVFTMVNESLGNTQF